MRFHSWDYLGNWNYFVKYKDNLSTPYELYLSRNDTGRSKEKGKSAEDLRMDYVIFNKR